MGDDNTTTLTIGTLDPRRNMDIQRDIREIIKLRRENVIYVGHINLYHFENEGDKMREVIEKCKRRGYRGGYVLLSRIQY